jgi:histidine triad (HIT) family protein
MSTLFEKIVAGEIPADIVYQDDEVTAFRDINAMAPVHLLVIPNQPIPTAADVEPEHAAVLGKLFLVARKVAEDAGIAESGYRLIVNCGDDARMEVPHLHMHVIGGRQLEPMNRGI